MSMSAPSELKTLVKQLQGSSTEQDIITILQTLKQEAKITETILRESKAGLAVGKLRSHQSKAVADLAKEIVKKWKSQVEAAKQGGGGGAKSVTPTLTKQPPSRKQSVASVASAKSATPTPTPSTPGLIGNGSKSEIRSAKYDGVRVEPTGDKTRDKCAELIYDALASDSAAPSDMIIERAKGVEAAVYSEFGSASGPYKAKIRSLYVNLRDKGNPGLRESIVSGELSVQKFAKMTSQEMASEQRKAEDQKIRDENLFKTLGAEEVQAETDAFQCGRCKQRKCRYRQAQTRSADEPMTTFVTCTVCNHRWKFS